MEKYSYKLTTEIRREIIEYAIIGYSSSQIAEKIAAEHGISICPQTVRYHRLKSRKKILKKIDEELEIAKLTEPFAILSNRLKARHDVYLMAKREIPERESELIDAADKGLDYKKRLELKQRIRELYKAMNDAVDGAMKDIHNKELEKIRYEELDKKYEEEDENELEEIVATVTKKIEIRKRSGRSKRNANIADEVQWIEE